MFHLGVHHQNLQQGHISVTRWTIQRNQYSLIAADQILENVKDDLFVLEVFSWRLQQSYQRCNEDWRFKTDGHLFQESFGCQEIQIW